MEIKGHLQRLPVPHKAPMFLNPLAKQPRTPLLAPDNSVLILIPAYQTVIIGLPMVLTDWKLIIPAPVSAQIADTLRDVIEGGARFTSLSNNTSLFLW